MINSIHPNLISSIDDSPSGQIPSGFLQNSEVTHINALLELYQPGEEVFSFKTGVAAMMWIASIITVVIAPIAFAIAYLMDCCRDDQTFIKAEKQR